MRQSTPTCMVLGELGKMPVEIVIKGRVLSYWFRLIQPDNQGKIAAVMYRLMFQLHTKGLYESRYITFVKNTLQDIGMNDFWVNQNGIPYSLTGFKAKVKRALQDRFLQNWYSSVDNDSIYLNYRMYKPVFCTEGYLSILPHKLAIRLARFRTTSNQLPVNRLRFLDVPRNDRVCQKCDDDIGDEFHYLFCCQFFSNERKQYLPPYFQRRPNAIKFAELFKLSKTKLLKVAHFIDLIQKKHLVPGLNILCE